MVASPPVKSQKKARRQMSPGARERMLKDPAVRAAWGAAAIRQEEKRLAKQRDRLYGHPEAQESGVAGRRGGLACSHAWADDNWERSVPYPPGGDQTLMVRCRGCGAYTPPQNVGSSGHCDDCRLGSMSAVELSRLPSSPCLIDMARLKGARLRGMSS